MQPDCGSRIENLFFSLNLARDFDDLTGLLGHVLACKSTVIERKETSSPYEVTVDDEQSYLKFKIKSNVMQHAA